MKICLVSAPLEARSGVYRTTHDLVTEARSRGLEWTGIIGLRPGVPAGTSPVPEGISELTISEHGFAGVRAIERAVMQSAAAREADAVITLITQSDLALSRLQGQLPGIWIAYVRGIPWPAKGEQSAFKRLAQKTVETRALRKAVEVWATTQVLADEVALARTPRLVPAGIPSTSRRYDGRASRSRKVVWAGRMALDKQPLFFLDVMRDLPAVGEMHGVGPLLSDVEKSAPDSVTISGWSSPDELWRDAEVFLGTSFREAFGRSAVEAAAAGVPVVIGDQYGAAPFLYTDPDLRRRFVLPASDPAQWRHAVTDLLNDDDLRRTVSDHVHANASELTIARSVDRIGERIEYLMRS